MIKTKYQTGSAHVVAIVIIIVVILGALGFVLWKNFIAPDTSTSQSQQDTSTEEQAAKKSEIIDVPDSDMNKYVNYELGFEFEFPKQAYWDVRCEERSTVFDRFGNKIPAPLHYGAGQGVASVTVLDAEDRHIITYKQSVVLSDREKLDGGQTIAKSCNVEPTTVSMIDTDYGPDAKTSVGKEYRTFHVTKASDQSEIIAYVKKALDNDDLTIANHGDVIDGRQDMVINFGDPRQAGMGAYKLWFYPEQNLLVYILLGQAAAFQYPDGSNKWYIDRIVDSFTLR